jgi:predicted DNA binding CopG/RHH family protein
MSQEPEFPFDRARRVTPEEHLRFKTAVVQQFGSKSPEEPYESVQLHPKIITWAKAEAQKRGVEYQMIINEILLEKVS